MEIVRENTTLIDHYFFEEPTWTPLETEYPLELTANIESICAMFGTYLNRIMVVLHKRLKNNFTHSELT